LITDRINAAVQGLGAEKIAKVTKDGQLIERTEPTIEVRIGIILALERIAKNNLDMHIQIMEILCAFVRHNDQPKVDLKTIREFIPNASNVDPFAIPSIITQTALNVIGRRNEKQIEAEQREKFSLDLSDCHFGNLQFSNANFQNISFGLTFYGQSISTTVICKIPTSVRYMS
jgi:hypothetical protein